MAGAPQVTPLVVRQGEPQANSAPFYATFSGKGSQESVRFHLLVESSAMEPEALCRRALSSLQRVLTAGSRASLTTVIQEAYQACHKELEAANASQDLAARVGVGATCVAVRGEETYVAAVGDAVIYQRDQHGVRKVTPAVRGTESPALGVSPEPVTVALERPALKEGESLLVASGALEGAVSYDGLEAIMATDPRAASEKLGLLMGEDPLFVALILHAPAP